MKTATEKKLRRGFSTGACAAAAATAAWVLLREGKVHECLEVLFPDGKLRTMAIAGCRFHERGGAEAVIIKDGGDDPDVTDGIHLRAVIREVEEEEILPEDFRLDCGGRELVLRGGPGIGKVTRPGLDVAPGKWAINSTPRRMICDNLSRAGYGQQSGRWLASIIAEDGEKIARKTLNPTLGILGGISILGTSGIVVPYSHAAYIATIKVLLEGARAAGCDTIALATGGRTQQAVARDFPDLPDLALVRIGDFIADSLKIVAAQGFNRVIVACMYGKLYKYAQGHTYTHAHKVALTCADLAEVARRVGASTKQSGRCAASRSVREALESFPAGLRDKVLEQVGHRAWRQLESWCPAVEIEIRLYDPAGGFIRSWSGWEK